jgi:hypothetical protein
MRIALLLATSGVVLVIAGAGLPSGVKTAIVLAAGVIVCLNPLWWILRGIQEYRASRRLDD